MYLLSNKRLKHSPDKLALSKPFIIDSHCHLDFAAFAKDHASVISQCEQNGVTDIVIPGVTAATLTQLISFCAQKTNSLKLYYALGLHPVFLDQHEDSHIDQLADLLVAHKPIAVGEIGLDFFIKELDKNKQLALFSKQLELAIEQQLPVILHVRKAHDEIINSLKQHNFAEGGIVHAFNGSIQQAHHYIDRGFKLGFGGMLTYQRSSKLHKLAKQLPLSSIVLETDSPDMTVEPHRGKRNSPEYLPMVLNALSDLRKEPIELIAETTSNSVKQVLKLSATA